MDSAALPIIIALLTGTGGIGLAIAALRKVKPESAKMELEGRSSWMIAQTDFLEEIREDNTALRDENRAMRDRMSALEARMRELERAEMELHKANEVVERLSAEHENALRRAVQAEHRVVALEGRVGVLERILREEGLGHRLAEAEPLDADRHMD